VTATDTLEWYKGRGTDIGFGISPAREAEVLAAWHAA